MIAQRHHTALAVPHRAPLGTTSLWFMCLAGQALFLAPAAASAQDASVAPAAVAQAAQDPADASSPPAAEPDAAEEHDATSDERPTEDSDPRIKFQAVGAGFHTTMFATAENYGYTLMGPSLTYQYYIGKRWGFSIRGEVYFPMSGRYAGPTGDLRTGLRNSYNAQHFGLDGQIGVARRLELSSSAALMLGMGVHVQSFKLSGDQYTPIEGITGGLGGFARLDWRVHRVVSLGADFAVGMDPIDFIRHQNRAVITVPVSLSLSLGVTY